MERDTLNKLQREVRERVQIEGSEDLRTALQRIKDAPVKTDDEYMSVLSLINSLNKRIDPGATFVLQIEVTLRHYNANKSPTDPDMSIIDGLILALGGKGES